MFYYIKGGGLGPVTHQLMELGDVDDPSHRYTVHKMLV